MKRPTPPFLELSFYFAEMADTDALVHVLAALTSEGAQFAGSGMVHSGRRIGEAQFSGINDALLEAVSLNNLDEAKIYATVADIRLVQVEMRGASAAGRTRSELITYISISPGAMLNDHHPIAIWTTGALFSGPADKSRRRQRRRVGSQIQQRFLDLIRILRPSYAAVTVEIALECPTDLRIDARTGAFQEFYVSENYLGAHRMSRVLNSFPNAYRETIADGWYISCWGDFNPQGREVEHGEANKGSSAVVALIAELAPKH